MFTKSKNRCRSPHGERGLKSKIIEKQFYVRGRSPHGERGLKSVLLELLADETESLPSRGAWIEIYLIPSASPSGALSLPSRGAWIEIEVAVTMNTIKPSLPSRGAWIEMVAVSRAKRPAAVAPLTGSVD